MNKIDDICFIASNYYFQVYCYIELSVGNNKKIKHLMLE